MVKVLGLFGFNAFGRVLTWCWATISVVEIYTIVWCWEDRLRIIQNHPVGLVEGHRASHSAACVFLSFHVITLAMSIALRSRLAARLSNNYKAVLLLIAIGCMVLAPDPGPGIPILPYFYPRCFRTCSYIYTFQMLDLLSAGETGSPIESVRSLGRDIDEIRRDIDEIGRDIDEIRTLEIRTLSERGNKGTDDAKTRKLVNKKFQRATEKIDSLIAAFDQQTKHYNNQMSNDLLNPRCGCCMADPLLVQQLQELSAQCSTHVCELKTNLLATQDKYEKGVIGTKS